VCVDELFAEDEPSNSFDAILKNRWRVSGDVLLEYALPLKKIRLAGNRMG
jgi:hypothetical protein